VLINLCRKRTKKKIAKVGRKKTKTSADGDDAPTPRTRGALAREAAERARRDAEEAELLVAAAREKAEAAARELAEATTNEYEAAFEEEAGLSLIPLATVAPDPSIAAATARR